ncbi:metal ABC transporter ATP-binding protein [Tessaracoccus coleopterorum]|uniref:metal ABC transporter ATP-binding protein n=1 Tax=Tessaracoccus coleopterorum TaxID=2714950 RepID=UPI0038CD512A
MPGFGDWWKVGYVPQHSAISVPNATVREIASAGRLAHRRPFQWLRRSDREIVTRSLEQVDLAARADWPFKSLSGGQKQRVLIARALASNPELLIMDEPFAGVDLHSQAGLAELLGRLRDEGLGMLVVLHERGPMTGILNRAVTLCDGRIVDHEPPSGGACIDDTDAMPDPSASPTPSQGASSDRSAQPPLHAAGPDRRHPERADRPAIGTFIVQRRMSLLGDGLGHVAIMGVGLAMWTGWARSRSRPLCASRARSSSNCSGRTARPPAISAWRSCSTVGSPPAC